MIIERIQVEEGFLDGLDLTFTEGLNTIIGPRGTGKTSVIELIRFCLGVKGYTDESESSARQHALSVLGSGQVTVTLRMNGETALVSRTASDESPRRASSFGSPQILSQNEIEAIGLHPTGRLRIIDGFRADRTSAESRAESVLSQIRSLTVEARGVAKEAEQIRESLSALSGVPEELAAAEKEQAATLKAVTSTAPQQAELERLTAMAAAEGVRTGVLERAQAAIEQWKQRVDSLVDSPLVLDRWPESAGQEDQLQQTRDIAKDAVAHIGAAQKRLDQAIAALGALRHTNHEERLAIEEKARHLRRVLEEAKKGAGARARRVSDLKEKVGQVSALQALLKEKQERLENVLSRRNEYLDQLETHRGQRFEERMAVASSLNAELGPRIEIALERGGLHHEYINAITAALRGSGVHYGSLAPQLAQEVSPRELAEAAERRDPRAISELVGISPDRAAVIVNKIGEYGTDGILTCIIDDAVRLSLLDGAEYKSTEDLSTGQRCTVILPILLGHRTSVLIVDQPEDHLDNAFIVDTVIEAIRKRKREGQLIFVSHNANIPVLGEASNVILFGSDGRRGFVKHTGPLDDPASVRAITSVMEGGREAFLRRARFYAEHLGPDV